ncbi:MAG: hypothetical protein F6K62_06140 [Sphaerospermopsis sp. SIO1G2]|nr:hypothetical protein [Sphaerospermopsis sp. SIO1G2]
MAAAITTTAPSLEGQSFEIAQALQNLELQVPTDTRPDNVSIEHDLEAQTTTITITIPHTSVTDGSGSQIISAGTYL